MTRTIAIISLSALALGACRGGHAAERIYVSTSPDDPAAKVPHRTITTSGKATLTVIPDLAEVRVTLEVENVSSSVRAAELINKKKERMLAESKKLGIPTDRVVQGLVQINPIYSPWVRGKLSVIIGYNAKSHVTLKIKDFDRIAPSFDAATRAGATRVTTTFRSTKLTEFKSQVYDMALEAARKKAEQMASALGVEKMQIRTVNEGRTGGGWYWDNGVSNISNAMEMAPQPNGGGATASVTPDATELTLTISVVYEVI